MSNHPNWRSHIFQRGGPTTNQFHMCLLNIAIFGCLPNVWTKRSSWSSWRDISPCSYPSNHRSSGEQKCLQLTPRKRVIIWNICSRNPNMDKFDLKTSYNGFSKWYPITFPAVSHHHPNIFRASIPRSNGGAFPRRQPTLSAKVQRINDGPCWGKKEGTIMGKSLEHQEKHAKTHRFFGGRVLNRTFWGFLNSDFFGSLDTSSIVWLDMLDFSRLSPVPGGVSNYWGPGSAETSVFCWVLSTKGHDIFVDLSIQ